VSPPKTGLFTEKSESDLMTDSQILNNPKILKDTILQEALKEAKMPQDDSEPIENKKTDVIPVSSKDKETPPKSDQDSKKRSKKKEAVIKPLSSYERKEVSWLWPSYIPKGNLTIIEGNPGLGKSMITCKIAACESTGVPYPHSTLTAREPAKTLMLLAEDSIYHTVRPRIEDNGGDLDNINIFEAVKNADGSLDIISLRRDLDLLREELGRGNYTNLVIDPFTAFLGDIDNYKETDSRLVLTPLKSIAEEFEISVIAVRHLRKSSSGKAILDGGGSIAFSAAARAVFTVIENPEVDGECLFVCTKASLSAKPPGIAFKIDGGNKISFLREVELTAQQALDSEQTADNTKRPAREDAKAYLLSALSEGPQPSEEVLKFAAKEGHARSTVLAAKRELPISTDREGFGGKCVWVLDEENTTSES